MSDTNESNPDDQYAFVDKRRVSEPTDAADDLSQESVPDSSVSEEELSSAADEDRQPSIYDIAAYCTGLLITEGFQRLGLIANPQTGKAIMDLPSARVAIDCVAALVNVIDAPDSTLDEPIRREMKRTLNDLRLNFVDRTRS